MTRNFRGEKPGLRDMQRWLRWAVTEPRGVAAALAEPGAAEPAPRLLKSVADAPPLSREARLDIYAEAYFSRLREALAADFEVSRLVLGEDGFGRLAARYFAAHPSRTRTIGEIGRDLPAFAASWEEGFDKPYLSDLALLEWTLIEAFYASDVAPLDPASLAAVPPDAWEGARLILDPSVKILVCEWPVDELWHARHGDWQGVLTRLSALPAPLLVHRPRHDLRVERLCPSRKTLLDAFLRGVNLNDALACVKDGETDAFQGWFAHWVKNGVIRKVEF